MELKYDKNVSGATIVAKSGAQIRDVKIGSGTVWDVNAGDYALCTGYFYDVDPYDPTDFNVLLQLTNGLYANFNLENPEWTVLSGRKSVSKSGTQAQSIINTIIANNRHIIQNNLLCARFADKLSDEERSMLYDLQVRLEDRNERLYNDTFLKDATTSSPAGYSELLPYLKKFMNRWNDTGVGLVLSTTAVIIISAVVVASLATAAYYAYKSFADQSEKDVKFSDKLTRTLMDKLTPEEYEQLKTETKGIVTKARLRERIGTSSKYIALGAGVVAVILGLLYYKKKG